MSQVLPRPHSAETDAPPVAGPARPDDALVDWARVRLPDAWPDRMALPYISHFWLIFRAMWRKRCQKLQLPDGLPGVDRLPKYLLQEFHYLPNGNYSRSITRGYARGFDRVMLGTLRQARRLMAETLRDATRVLDVGTGAGHLAGALQAAGIPEVWALEPSPYLLQHAARDYPGLRCVQGVIEDSGLPDGHFDAAGACFVFHEIPPRHADRALAELHRLIKPGGKLLIVEPSPAQLSGSRRQLWQRHGWRGLYFRALAGRVHEPFLAAWHDRDHAAWLDDHGFELIEDRDQLPWRMLSAVRRA